MSWRVPLTVRQSAGEVAAQRYLKWLRRLEQGGWDRAKAKRSVVRARRALRGLSKAKSQRIFLDVVEQRWPLRSRSPLHGIRSAFRQTVMEAEMPRSPNQAARLIRAFMRSHLGDGEDARLTDPQKESIRHLMRRALDALAWDAYRTTTLDLVRKGIVRDLDDEAQRLLLPLVEGLTPTE